MNFGEWIESYRQWHPVLQAAIAGGFTWLLTMFGAGAVLLIRSINRRLLDSMLGFAAGVMLAASYWSLLAPAVAIAEHQGNGPAWVPVVGGFALGAAIIGGLDRLLPHLHLFKQVHEAEGLRMAWQRSVLLVLAITLHNIPEGLAVGVTFAGAVTGLPDASFGAAMALAIGIGIQNVPEGIAVAIPLRGEGVSRFRAFNFGHMSAAVEPIAAVLGAFAVSSVTVLLPWALAFAAGAMVYVVVEELIPESHQGDNVDLATLSLIGGFCVMTALDVGLG